MTLNQFRNYDRHLSAGILPFEVDYVVRDRFHYNPIGRLQHYEFRIRSVLLAGRLRYPFVPMFLQQVRFFSGIDMENFHMIGHGHGKSDGLFCDPVPLFQWSKTNRTRPRIADLYPTVLAMAGVPDAAGHRCDGESLAPLLRRTGTPTRDALYWHYPHYQLYQQGGTAPYGAVRVGDWKLIEFYDGRPAELYDLRTDPGEFARPDGNATGKGG